MVQVRKGSRSSAASSTLWCMLVAAASAAMGAQHWVSPTGDDTADGSPRRPFRTIRHAVDAAAAGDTVWVRVGRYEECVRIEGEEGGEPEKWLTVSAAADSRSGSCPSG